MRILSQETLTGSKRVARFHGIKISLNSMVLSVSVFRQQLLYLEFVMNKCIQITLNFVQFYGKF